jgi:hypothetical protein
MSYVHCYYKHIDVWSVGYFDIELDGERVFRELRKCDSGDEAAAFINYLNGGSGQPFGEEE